MTINSKPLIGLLGAPGSGKSTVAGCFARLGCGVINADKLNHAVLAREDIARRLADMFNSDILGDNGSIDRKKLSALVFSGEGKENLKKLEDVVHPEIFKLIESEIIRLGQEESVPAIILDIPLLLEVGLDKRCDHLIFVSVSDEIRGQRLSEKRGWDEKLVKNIEKSQILLDKKREISDYMLVNNSDTGELLKQVESIFPKIMQC
ncbi:MAG: dephospho-CoA kinase [Sedimentisphaerales bacterium]|nr:dephospho-CoA kinase [Sedimentisphaerales bacterium]MBN2844194.1 dephospho-CoA kinase [Sedimentisphaerales bacterium]